MMMGSGLRRGCMPAENENMRSSCTTVRPSSGNDNAYIMPWVLGLSPPFMCY